jgi:hypothetical protein
VEVRVLYIPSVLACYALTGPEVSIQLPDEQEERHPRARVQENSDEIARRIEGICAAAGLPFADARPKIRAAARNRLIHGPRDWKHFNEAGYRALAGVAADLIQTPGA